MNLDSLNKWLMLVANVGVVAGIIFLIVEVNQNTTSTKAQTRAMLTDQVNANVDLYLRDDVIAIVIKRASGQELTPEERVKNSIIIRRQFRTFENIFYQYRLGTFDSDEYIGIRNVWQDNLSTPEFINWWNENRNESSSRFQEEIDQIISEN